MFTINKFLVFPMSKNIGTKPDNNKIIGATFGVFVEIVLFSIFLLSLPFHVLHSQKSASD